MVRVRNWLLTMGACAVTAALPSVNAFGQGATTYPQAAQAPAGMFSTAGSGSRAPGTNPALSFYGRPKSLQYASRMRSSTPLPAPRPVQTAPIPRPPAGVQQASVISPYLALNNLEASTSLPNYYMYVKPQLDLARQNQVQQAQYWQVQQQLRTATAGGAITGSPAGGMPTTGHSTQFMNSGGYYPGLR